MPALQPSGNVGAGGRSAGSPFGRAAVRPRDQRRAVGVAQQPLIVERPRRRVGVPRRHVPVADFVADRLRPGPRILVGQQRHRRDFAGPVAARAVLEDDRRDVLAERRHALLDRPARVLALEGRGPAAAIHSRATATRLDFVRMFKTIELLDVTRCCRFRWKRKIYSGDGNRQPRGVLDGLPVRRWPVSLASNPHGERRRHHPAAPLHLKPQFERARVREHDVDVEIGARAAAVGMGVHRVRQIRRHDQHVAGSTQIRLQVGDGSSRVRRRRGGIAARLPACPWMASTRS